MRGRNPNRARNPSRPGLIAPSAPSIPVNLLTANQSSIETDTTGLITGGGDSISRSTSHASHGSASVAVQQTEVGPAGIAVATLDGASGRPVQPNQQYTAMADVRHTGVARTATLSIYWYTSAGALIGFNSGTTAADTSSYVQRTVTATSPVNAAYAAINVVWDGAILNEVHHADRLGIIVGSGTTWVLGTG